MNFYILILPSFLSSSFIFYNFISDKSIRKSNEQLIIQILSFFFSLIKRKKDSINFVYFSIDGL